MSRNWVLIAVAFWQVSGSLQRELVRERTCSRVKPSFPSLSLWFKEGMWLSGET